MNFTRRPSRIDFLDRFYSRVDKRGPSECWPWLGAKNRHGYGLFGTRSHCSLAHRISYELATATPLANGTHCLHSCDNPACVNPSHLRAGTQADNMADMKQKGRQPKASGQFNGNAKLSPTDVIAIRQSSESALALARRFGITRQAVLRVKNGKAWASIGSAA